MKSKRAFAAAVLSLFSALPAAATEGWYLSLEGGGSWVKDWEHTRTLETWCGPVVKEAVAELEAGWAAFGAAGFGIDNWRVEVEGGYRQNNLEAYVLKWRGPKIDGEALAWRNCRKCPGITSCTVVNSRSILPGMNPSCSALLHAGSGGEI